MHLAAAVQTPCVAVFAAIRRPAMWFPYGAQHRVIYHDVPCSNCSLDTCIENRKQCITSVTVDEMMQATVEQLARVVSRGGGTHTGESTSAVLSTQGERYRGGSNSQLVRLGESSLPTKIAH